MIYDEYTVVDETIDSAPAKSLLSPRLALAVCPRTAGLQQKLHGKKVSHEVFCPFIRAMGCRYLRCAT